MKPIYLLDPDNWEKIGGYSKFADFFSSRRKYRYEEIIQRKKDFSRGIIPTALCLCTIQRIPPRQRPKIGKTLWAGEKITILKIKNTIVVTFRSTITFGELFGIDLALFRERSPVKLENDFKEWKKKVHSNLKEKKPTTLFHSGFIKEYNKQKYNEIINRSIKKSKIKNPKVVLLGRSMGGALASIAGLMLSITNPELKFSIISISAPAISNSYISMYFSYLLGKKTLMNYIRLYNKDDTVTSIKTDGLGTLLNSKLRHPFQFAKNNQTTIVKSNKTEIKNGAAIIDVQKQTRSSRKKYNMGNNILVNHSIYTLSFKKKDNVFFTYRPIKE
tara:strand:- start:431 stop:1423 length:993 start_codon:yes stop_codon:yes gene_type:complete